MEKEFTPRITSFVCKWCTYTGADLAGTSRLQYPTSIILLRVLCSSRIDPVFLIKSYLKGADGVLIGGCHPGDCHYETGNYHARRRFKILTEIFATLGLPEERLRLSWISASEGPKFAQIANEFTDKIKSLGPNDARTNMFL
ncbi:MAG: hydrogenase iron-sulfur subunit [Candidatus Marinimicrobia bacterium]|nr:hydrogenase iron-sulfur subunit [Candidatus Neomarinimicrobiota bacterium]